MANEYLKRTPTSTGNRRVWTWSGWIKQPKFNGSTLYTLFSAYSSGYPNRSYFVIDSDGRLNVITYEGAYVLRFYSQNLIRDNSSWTNILFSVDTTKGNGAERVSLFSNGAKLKIDETNYNEPSINYQTYVNLSSATHGIGYDIGLGGRPYDGHMTDVFFIDGQALTPEVFGFYKDGNGYISAGSAQSTDFRNGQWVPRTPREIKNLINDNGGFGVNGFYLPMNDSSNFGADFHTTPNSIITLKGENLPQPRNGAPETTDAYVSQLRTDPYAANLVLAVPGISTSTSANLITNGTFDSNVSGWTAQNAVISWDEGELQVDDSANAGSYSSANQTITTVIGKRYTMTVDIISTSGTPSIAVYSSGWTASSGDVFYSTYSSTGKKQVIFTATSTSSTISLQTSGTTLTVYDNVVVRQEDAPLDYSADIKGSGTNKTLTANGNAGVGYEIPSYYGSALSFDGTGDYFSTTSGASDFDLGTDDFTVEGWVYPQSFSNYPTLINIKNTTASSDLYINFRNSSTLALTNNTTVFAGSSGFALNQWNHFALVRSSGSTTMYGNGVAGGPVACSIDFGASFTGTTIGSGPSGGDPFTGYIQDLRVYKGVAKYKGGFDVPKPYTPVGISTWRAVPDTCQNNFATLNPLASRATHTNGNLTAAGDNSVSYSAGISNFMVNSGKWYCEVRLDEMSSGTIPIGISELENGGFTDIYGGTEFFGKLIGTDTVAGIRIDSGVLGATDGSIARMWIDLDSSPISFSVQIDNNSPIKTYNSNDYSEDTIVSNKNNLIEGRTYGFVAADAQGAVAGIQFTFNFGQNPTFSGNTTAGTYTDSNGKGLFKYQPPSGFLALCEDNLLTPTIKDPGEYFKTVLYTGTGSSRNITGVGFQPDLVWIKDRDSTAYNYLFDSFRHTYLWSNHNGAEGTIYQKLTFDIDGFSLVNGTDGSYPSEGNRSGNSIVAWCWKAGGPTVTNTDGSIISRVSVNQTAGFSIVSWTSTGSNDALQTVGHGLNTAPNMIILKNRDASVNWRVYHSGITSGNSLTLNATEASYSFWPSVGNDTFGLANSTTTGQASGTGNQDIIAYCWSEIEGFSKFGSYVGNGNADGSFVYCGFKPAFVMLKASSTTGNWCMIDNARNSTNPTNFFTVANASNNGDDTGGALDFLSNGFKLRLTSSNFNGNGVTYIFAAFAESPYKYANSK
jgi:hypothetical protein